MSFYDQLEQFFVAAIQGEHVMEQAIEEIDRKMMVCQRSNGGDARNIRKLSKRAEFSI